MNTASPVATIPVSFFDRQTGLSALAIQHIRCDGCTTLVYHDAPRVTAALPLLAGVAEALLAGPAGEQPSRLIESSMPEHTAEAFVYAEVSFSSAASGVPAPSARLVGVDEVARACGVSVREILRTQVLVTAVYTPRCCAFAGFRQLPVGAGGRRILAVA